MLKILTVLCHFLLLFPPASARTRCELSLLTISEDVKQGPRLPDGQFFPSHQGVEVHEGPFTAGEFRKNNIFKLGTGKWGGTVYRLISKDQGLRRIIKVYSSRKKLVDDLRGFAILKSGLAGATGIQVAEYRDLGGVRMEVQDLYGESLENVLDRGLFAKSELEKYYRGLVPLLIKQLSEKYGGKIEIVEVPDPKGLASLQAFLKVRPGRVDWVYFKPDNIIVDSRTLQMYVIDPI